MKLAILHSGKIVDLTKSIEVDGIYFSAVIIDEKSHRSIYILNEEINKIYDNIEIFENDFPEYFLNHKIKTRNDYENNCT
jgi:asparagine synthetase A